MNFSSLFKFNKTPKMPVLFLGHGSPMNAIEHNEFSQNWQNVTQEIPTPNAILCISAHWVTNGIGITAMKNPRTIHDFYGFPDELYTQNYPAPGDPDLAKQLQTRLNAYSIIQDHEWGLDHGAWSLLQHMYPKANIPVIQLSLDYKKSAKSHFDFAKELAYLREKGILILGSGNIIHNLRLLQFQNDFNAPFAFDWALEIDANLKEKLQKEDFLALTNYDSLSKAISLAIPTPEHYLPLLYVLAQKTKNDSIKIFNDRIIAGSLSMTSILIH